MRFWPRPPTDLSWGNLTTPPTPPSTTPPPARRSGTIPTAKWTSSSAAWAPAAPSPAWPSTSRSASPASRPSPSNPQTAPCSLAASPDRTRSRASARASCRVMQHNVLAMSGKAVEAAGDVNTLLLDKTGTITLGNRQAVEFLPIGDAAESELADAAQLSSLADETPEGRSIVVLAKEKYAYRGREIAAHEAHFIPFTAQTRMSGVDIDARRRVGKESRS